MTARACPACHASGARLAGRKSGYDVSRCRACGTLFADCEQAAPEGLYDDYYADSANMEVPGYMAVRLDQIVRSFAPYRMNNRLLDVGFGGGAMIAAAQRAGWDVYGVEVSPAAVSHVRKHCGNVTQGFLEDARFDVVLASELLEHLYDPDAFLREILRIVRPGGLFWATTPHGRGLSARVLGTDWSVVHPPEHLQLFSVPGMRTMLHRVGFSRSRIDTHGMDPFELARKFKKVTPVEAPVHRVNSLQGLNRRAVESTRARVAKQTINAVLNVSRLGDSLKVFATA
jgi:SAM-dependent methyltransferase